MEVGSTNLSIRLSTRYEREGKQEDLTWAIKYGQEAADLTPKENPDRAGYLNNLSSYLNMCTATNTPRAMSEGNLNGKHSPSVLEKYIKCGLHYVLPKIQRQQYQT